MISCNGASCNTGQLRSDIWKLLPEVNATARTEKTLVQGTDNDPTMSRLSHSFCFPRLWTHHQEAMPKSCLLVFPHAERKRQNNPSFYFWCFSSLPLRFKFLVLPTFFPKLVHLCGVLTPLKGLHSWAAWGCFCLPVCVPGMLSH